MKHDIICFCHLRWNFVYQRPQHLLTRFAHYSRVFVMEEPEYGAENNYLEIKQVENKLIWIAVPKLRNGLNEQEKIEAQRILLDELIMSYYIHRFIAWYYSPMPLSFSDHINPAMIVYDCMDELSGFNGAPESLVNKEKELFQKANVVFTGGHNLYKAKRTLHSNIYPIPSSIDKAHFATARLATPDPEDQAPIPHPRLGFYGVIDERLNLQLLDELSSLKPDWHFVIIGPVVKIDPATLPRKENIHYLGGKSYDELPAYLGGWDIAMMPFALNRSTQYISPTKTPEFLAGGKQVISTSIADVVDPYGREGLVFIADDAPEFIRAAETALPLKNDKTWLKNADRFLSNISWDKTFQTMQQLIQLTFDQKQIIHNKTAKSYV
ncbi:MAG: glycosyltransferase family 1 protein [Ferruginibacter sp.]